MKKTLKLFFIPFIAVMLIFCTVLGVWNFNGKSVIAETKANNAYGELKFSFEVMSDIEVYGNGTSTEEQRFDRALKQIKSRVDEGLVQKNKALVLNGDITARGTVEQYNCLLDMIKNCSTGEAVYPVIGNHDLDWNRYDAGDSYETVYQDFVEGTGRSTYYDDWIDGYHFIFFGQESMSTQPPYYSDTQLTWIENKVKENAELDKPIFLFTHIPIRNTVTASYPDSISGEAKARLMKLFDEYPQIIFFSGHTHADLNNETIYYNTDAVNGTGVDMFGSSAISYIGKFADPTGQTASDNSQFLFVEVYENAVVVKYWDCKKEKIIGEKVVDTTCKVQHVKEMQNKIEIYGNLANAESPVAYVTYDDDRRVQDTDSGAWVGIVSSDSSNGTPYRYVPLRNLEKDGNGRYIWNMATTGSGSTEWNTIKSNLASGTTYNICVFEDTNGLSDKNSYDKDSKICSLAINNQNNIIYNLDSSNVTMTAGASIKVDSLSKSGIRFEANFNKEYIDGLKTNSAVQEYLCGVLIVPEEYLTTYNNITHETLNGSVYLDVRTPAFRTDNGENYSVYASMVNVKKANYDKKFIGVGYIKVVSTDGTINYYYSSVDKDNLRSIKQVAEFALENPSGYTSGQLLTLKEYVK